MAATIEHLYREYKNDVYSYLIHLTHNKALSEDLTSETFLIAIQSLSSFKGNSSIKTWLFGIARNKWYEHLRRERKTVTQEDLLAIYARAETDMQDSAIIKACIGRIYMLLEEQSAMQRDVFLMRVEGYSFSEIAVKHSLSESSARVIDFRLRNKMKAILSREGYWDG